MIINDFIGIPFVNKGRSAHGADCYGIVELYYKHILNIEIEEIRADANNAKQCFVKYLDQISRNWVKVENPTKHSVVVMSTHPQHPDMITHFGVMIDDKRMLHTFKETQCHIMDINNPLIKTQIRGYYQWQH